MGFADSLKKICDETGENIEDAVKATAMEMLSSVVKMSPVGNPDIWKVNKTVMAARSIANTALAEQNANRPKGASKINKLSKSDIARTIPLAAGADYVGCRFRANWQIGISVINTASSREPDATGESAMQAGSAKMDTWSPGKTIYISNSLPYAMRLEYGWSTQAPGGMVRLTQQRFNTILDANIKAITKK